MIAFLAMLADDVDPMIWVAIAGGGILLIVLFRDVIRWLVLIGMLIGVFIAFLPTSFFVALVWIVFGDGWSWITDVVEDWREARAERKRLGDLARYL